MLPSRSHVTIDKDIKSKPVHRSEKCPVASSMFWTGRESSVVILKPLHTAHMSLSLELKSPRGPVQLLESRRELGQLSSRHLAQADLSVKRRLVSDMANAAMHARKHTTTCSTDAP